MDFARHKRETRAVRAGVRETVGYERTRKQRGDANWPYYTADARHYFSPDNWQHADDFVEAFPHALNEIKHLFQSDMSGKGAYIDFCGAASGASLGARKSYAVTLDAPHKNKPFLQDITIGSLLERRTLHELFKKVRADGSKFLAGTIVPIGGFEHYLKKGGMTPIMKVLEERYARAIAYIASQLEPGGVLYVEYLFSGVVSQFNQELFERYVLSKAKGVTFEWEYTKLSRSAVKIQKQRL